MPLRNRSKPRVIGSGEKLDSCDKRKSEHSDYPYLKSVGAKGLEPLTPSL